MPDFEALIYRFERTISILGRTQSTFRNYAHHVAAISIYYGKIPTLLDQEHAEVIEANKLRIELNKELYRKRQAIVEHPYGIIKRQWGFNYIMTKKTIKHASADVGLIFTAFNLRRIFNIIDHEMLKKYLKVLACFFLVVSSYFKYLYALVFLGINILPRKLTSF